MSKSKSAGVIQLRFACAVGIALFAIASGPSDAALVACPSTFTTSGATAIVHDGTASFNTAAGLCQYETTSVASPPNLASINGVSFFGFNDWEENGSPTFQTSINVNATTGSWLIDDVDFDMYDYLIVFKGGDVPLVALKFNESYSSGGFRTPFIVGMFNLGNNKTISSYSIFRRDNVAVIVPEPASLALLATALFGLGAARRRRA